MKMTFPALLRCFVSRLCVLVIAFAASLNAFASSAWLPNLADYMNTELQTEQLWFELPQFSANGMPLLRWQDFRQGSYNLIYKEQTAQDWQALYQGEANYFQIIQPLLDGDYSFRLDCSGIFGCPQQGYIQRTVQVVNVPDKTDMPHASYDDGLTQVSWAAHPDSEYYVLESSSDDGQSWDALSQYHLGTSFSSRHLPAGMYLFRVKSCNANGCGLPSTPSVPVGSKVLDVPAGFIVSLQNSDLDVDWLAVAGAEHYVLQISVDNGAVWSLEYSLTSVGYNRTDINDGQFVFRLKACNSVTCSDFTPVSAPIGQPYLPSPGVPKVSYDGQIMHVDWYSVLGATSYQLQSKDAQGVVVSYDFAEISEAEFTDLPAGQYAYRVKACHAATCSAFSDYSSALDMSGIAAPEAPSATLFDGDLKVLWLAVAEAEYYVLQLSSNGEAWITYDPHNTSLKYERSEVVDGSFRFRVQACSVNTCSDYSEPSSAVGTQVIDVPEILSATLFDGFVNIAWNKVADATEYKLQVVDGDGWETVHTLGDVDTYSRNDAVDGVFIFRVKACNQVTCSSYSAPSDQVGTQVFPAPTISSAILFDGVVNVAWNKIVGATSYQLQVVDDNSWETVHTLGDVDTYSRNDAVDGVFVFRVKACNQVTCSVYSLPSQPVGTLALAVPEHLSVALDNQSLDISWDVVANATLYQVQISDDGGSTWLDSAEQAATTLRLDDLADDTYIARVRACNNNTCGLYTPPSSEVSLGASEVAWSKSVVTVGQAVSLVGDNIPELVECNALEDEGISASVNRENSLVFYKITDGPLTAWRCSKAQGTDDFEFNSELEIKKLDAPVFHQ